MTPSIIRFLCALGFFLTTSIGTNLVLGCSSKPAPDKAAVTPETDEDFAEEEENAKPVDALCTESDKVEWWERMHCQLSTESDSPDTKAYKKCRADLKKLAEVPKERCPRILWLKPKVCDRWNFPTSKDHSECMQDEEFPKKVDESRGDYFGA